MKASKNKDNQMIKMIKDHREIISNSKMKKNFKIISINHRTKQMNKPRPRLIAKFKFRIYFFVTENGSCKLFHPTL